MKETKMKIPETKTQIQELKKFMRTDIIWKYYERCTEPFADVQDLIRRAESGFIRLKNWDISDNFLIIYYRVLGTVQFDNCKKIELREYKF